MSKREASPDKMRRVQTSGEQGDAVKLLRQAHERAGRLAEGLSRHRLELEKPCRSVPAEVLAEGEAAVRRAADAAAALREHLDEILRRQDVTPASTPTDQGRT